MAAQPSASATALRVARSILRASCHIGDRGTSWLSPVRSSKFLRAATVVHVTVGCHNRDVAHAPSRHGARLVGATAAVTAAYGVAVIWLIRPGTNPPPTSYAATSTTLHAADLAAGLGLMCAGVLATSQPRTRRAGLLAVVAGVAWFGADWDGWQGGPILLRSLGAASMPFAVAAIVHLVTAFPSGGLQSRLDRGVVWAMYAAAAATSVGLALVRDPFLDPYCVRNCIANAFLVHANPSLARHISSAWMVAAIAATTLTGAVAAVRLVASPL
jgi:hypothetical protein